MNLENKSIKSDSQNQSEEIHQGNQFKKIFSHGSWYLAASIFTKATSLILLPIYTRYLSPADYGIQSSLHSIQQLFPLFVSLYVDAAFARYYFLEKTISPRRVKELYSTHFWFIYIWGGGVVVTGLLVAPYTFQSLLDLPFYPYMMLTVIPPLISQLALLGNIFLRSNLKAKEISILNFLVFLCSTAIILILLVPYEMGIQARLYGMAFAAILNLGYFLWVSVRSSLLGFCFDWTVLKRSLVYSIPLIPNIAAGWITGLSDRLILAYYGRISEVGLYAVSAQLALIVYMINDAMTQVQGPISMSALTSNREAGKKQISEFLSFYIWIILLFYLGVTFFSKEVLYLLVDEKFHSAYRLVAILAYLYVMSGVYRIFTNVISFHEKTWVISTGAILSAMVNLALNFILIPHFGQLAAAWASFFSVFFYSLWIVCWAQKYDPIPINYRLIIWSFCLASILLLIQQSVELFHLFEFWPETLFKIVLFLSYLSAPYFFPKLKEFRLHSLNFRKDIQSPLFKQNG